MSEKKAPDNKREKEKERLIHVTEEQLQAGKAEIMKIVAGLNGAEKAGRPSGQRPEEGQPLLQRTDGRLGGDRPGIRPDG